MSKFENDTIEHIRIVNSLGELFCNILKKRLSEHDLSKLNNKEEKEAFESVLNDAKEEEYGTDAYFAIQNRLKKAVDLHYQNNSHHPEHFIDGIHGMNLIDLTEMFLDWAAATERHKNDNIHKSIDYNKERFDLPDALVNIFHNTANDLYL